MTLDIFEYARMRDEGLARVEANSDGWVALAVLQLEQLLSSLPAQFIPEDAKLKIIPLIGKPHHYNAWGAVFKKAIKISLIEKTGVYGHSRLPDSRGTAAPYYRAAS